MLEQIISYLQGCPQLKKYRCCAECLGSEAGDVSVQGVGCEPVLKQHADGGGLKQFMFKLWLRAEGGSAGNSEAEAFYQAVEEALTSGVPSLTEGRIAQHFEILQNGERSSHDYGSASYALLCRLIYYQKGE